MIRSVGVWKSNFIWPHYCTNLSAAVDYWTSTSPDPKPERTAVASLDAHESRLFINCQVHVGVNKHTSFWRFVMWVLHACAIKRQECIVSGQSHMWSQRRIVVMTTCLTPGAFIRPVSAVKISLYAFWWIVAEQFVFEVVLWWPYMAVLWLDCLLAVKVHNVGIRSVWMMQIVCLRHSSNRSFYLRFVVLCL